MVKPPYNLKPYTVGGVKGAQITCWRGGKEKKRSQEKIKVVKMRPQHLSHHPSMKTTTKRHRFKLRRSGDKLRS